MVNNVEQRLTVVLHRTKQFQRTDGKLIQTHITLFLDARKRGDVGNLRVQRLFQILQDSTSSNDTTLQMVNAKTLQRLYVEVLEKFLMGRLFRKYPVVEFESHETIAKVTFEVVFATPIVKHLLGLEITNELLHVIVSTLAHQEFTRRDVQERNATGRLAKMHSRKEVVLLVVQHRILHRHTWRHQFRNTSLDELLCQFGVFQLVADGYTFASTNQLRQISIKGMMGKTCHLVALIIAIIPVGERNAQYPRSNDGILAIGLVEVATTKQQQGLRVLCLEVKKLFHHRSQLLTFLRCHNACKSTKKKRNNQMFRSFIIRCFCDYLFTNLSFARVCSRSIKLEQAQFYSHLFTNFLPFLITKPL